MQHAKFACPVTARRHDAPKVKIRPFCLQCSVTSDQKSTGIIRRKNDKHESQEENEKKKRKEKKDYSNGLVEETESPYCVWTLNNHVIQQLPGAQNPDGVDHAQCWRANTDLAGENVGDWRWAGSVCTGLPNGVTSLAKW